MTPAEAADPSATSTRAISARAADPYHPAWEGVRQAIATAAQAVTLAVTEMRHALPCDDARVEMAARCAGVLDALAVPVNSIVLDEAIIAQREARAYDHGFQAGLAAARRCGTHRENPGHLRPVSDS